MFLVRSWPAKLARPGTPCKAMPLPPASRRRRIVTTEGKAHRRVRTYFLYGALAVAGCASPEQAFPRLADVTQPPALKTTPSQRAEMKRQIQAQGDATRAAGQMVRSGEDLTRPLPRQPY